MTRNAGSAGGVASLAGRLAGHRILVLEDHPLVAMDVTMALQEMGASVFSPKKTEESAMALLASDQVVNVIDAGVIDINLGDRTSEAVLRRLDVLGIPFVLYTGDPEAVLGLGVGHAAPVVIKPAHGEEIAGALVKVLDARHRARNL